MDVSITKGVDIRKEDTLQELTRIINDFKSKKVYRALLTQTGVAAPTATVLENTLGGTVVWTYTGVGQYTGTLINAFTLNRTFIFIQSDGNSELQYSGPNDADSIYVQTVRVDAQRLTASGDQVFQNDGLINTPIEIIVYV